MELILGMGLGLLFVVIGFLLYMLPFFIIALRGGENLVMHFFLNLFLNWTALGWIVMLIISFVSESGSQRGTRLQQTELLRRMAGDK